ncbi:hypothetical protein OEZ86_013766 [Tetradesmus obliquus]|nr:hypothetical protein OEZ86_013766 [Tetradesmus obliquus]
MTRPAAATAVMLLALLLIHGVASLPEAPKTMTARRLRTTPAMGQLDVLIGGSPGHIAARKLRQNPHATIMASAAGDVVVGGAKKLLAMGQATTAVEKGNRKLLHDAVRERATRIARKLADYDYDYRNGTAVALLALLLIHGVASLPDAPKAATPRRLLANPHPALMESAAGDVVLGGAKKLLADAHADTGEGKRALRNDALASPETHTGRKLAGYWRRWVTPWRYHRGRKLLADAVGAGEGKRALLSAAVAAHDDTRTGRKLAGYWRRWVTPWRYHRG